MVRICCLLCFVSLVTPIVANAQRFNPLGGVDRFIRESQEHAEEMRQRMEQMRGSLRPPSGVPGFPSGASRPGVPGGSFPGLSGDPSLSAQDQGPAFPLGSIKYPNGTNVLVRNEAGESVTARQHVTIGNTELVIMPSGEIRELSSEGTRPTSESFTPWSMDEVERDLLKNPKLKGFKTKRSRRFLYVYNTSELFIDSTRTILESMYPAVRKYFRRSGIDTHEPEFPLVIIAFATDDQFQEYRRMPQGVVAYYDSLANSVMLYEESDLSLHAPEIAVKNAISTIAHEGAHQILHNIGVQQRLSRWPMWLSEGLAEFYAPTSLQRGVRWSGMGSTNQLRMMEIDRDWNGGKALGAGRVLKRVVAADQLDSLDYAYSWSLIHLLSKRHQKELFACVRQCSELRPFDGLDSEPGKLPSSSEVFEKHFGDEYHEIEKELRRHLTSLDYVDPVKSQTHYLVVAGGQVILTTSPERVEEIQRSIGVGRAQVRRYSNRAQAEAAMNKISR
ncbi:Protein of unknown function [Neorhodopirellula lusitana]|uniref:DUF1570 domain-containing protein n=1 Tax=Neorhodopirellula lusitana TaxID=445327 RepID=A0ABY1QKB8_9BACT|nr:Protein of unknown function [Neorhodopirellula lusitana]